MNDDMHDDGLVHSHGWATEPPPSVGMLLRPANENRRVHAPEIADAMSVAQDDGHDDGLVHTHDWASQHSSRRFHG
jgi:hypothetical protein